jgi:hypothetical protein
VTKARPEQKIDAAVAPIMTIGRAVAEPVQAMSILENPAWGRLEDGWHGPSV